MGEDEDEGWAGARRGRGMGRARVRAGLEEVVSRPCVGVGGCPRALPGAEPLPRRPPCPTPCVCGSAWAWELAPAPCPALSPFPRWPLAQLRQCVGVGACSRTLSGAEHARVLLELREPCN